MTRKKQTVSLLSVPFLYLWEVAIPQAGEECLFWDEASSSKLDPKAIRRDLKFTRRYARQIVCEQAHGLAPSDDLTAIPTCSGGADCLNGKHKAWGRELAADKAA